MRGNRHQFVGVVRAWDRWRPRGWYDADRSAVPSTAATVTTAGTICPSGPVAAIATAAVTATAAAGSISATVTATAGTATAARATPAADTAGVFTGATAAWIVAGFGLGLADDVGKKGCRYGAHDVGAGNTATGQRHERGSEHHDHESQSCCRSHVADIPPESPKARLACMGALY
jgi:hypothetical protein